ncbi:hypothetical protein O9993_17230 [Vibrio lentus]|nr:hypothetical protein [Vibrio lentus]
MKSRHLDTWLGFRVITFNDGANTGRHHLGIVLPVLKSTETQVYLKTSLPASYMVSAMPFCSPCKDNNKLAKKHANHLGVWSPPVRSLTSITALEYRGGKVLKDLVD